MDEYYLQDNRQYVGNDVLWWRDGGGYTTDLSQAQIFSKASATRQHQCRESDIPWPKKYIDKKTRPAVDMQYIDINAALKGTGIELIKPQKPKKETYRCDLCGRFVSIADYHAYSCGCQD